MFSIGIGVGAVADDKTNYDSGTDYIEFEEQKVVGGWSWLCMCMRWRW